MRRLTVLLVAIVTVVHVARAQGSSFSGRVLTDSGVPIPGAQIVLAALQRAERTNAQGVFRFDSLPAGSHVVGIRAPGYAPRGDTIDIADAGEVRREYRLARIEATTTLPEVPVTATLLDRKLIEFRERRRLGVGRFLDSAEFANTRGTRTSDRLQKLPGLLIMRGRFSEAYIANTRQRSADGGWCRSLIWLDGVNVGTDFNVNELDPVIIAAVEWYAGQASIPAKYNVPMRAGQTYCGVLVIWMR
jgi:carboxypeptidase family protein